MYWDTVFAKDLPWSDSVSDGDLENSASRSPSTCDNVTDAEVSDETFVRVGRCQQDVGHMRIVVFIVMS